MPKQATQLQLEFTKADQLNNKARSSKAELRGVLSDHPEYQTALEQRQALNEKIKTILTGIGAAYPKLITELERLKREQQLEKEMLSDLALNQLMRGEQVEVSDDDGNIYEPIWSVRFKKLKQKNNF